MRPGVVDLVYLVSATLFVFALKGMSHPRRAVRGNALGSIGMLLAVVVTLLDQRIVRYDVIAAGVALGTIAGLLLATQIRMTAVPQLVALFNGVGGGASALVAGSVVLAGAPTTLVSAGSAVSGLVGAVTLSGSLVAMLKLQGWLRVKSKVPVAHRIVLAGCATAAAVFTTRLVHGNEGAPASYAALLAVALALGLLLVLPIGGGDMPVVVAFLNACSGLAAAATGFVLMNQALTIAGSLVGASGLILTSIMCRAMNRPLASVLFGAVGRMPASPPDAGEAVVPAKTISPDEVAMLLESARRVVIVPGYGMAVAQAQHAVAELSRELERRGIRVAYAIHPVAGRMPGHMNVLLAEAEVSYDVMFEIDTVNPEMADTDIALVIGANDVVNPLARTDPECPIYGMPIVNVDQARTAIVAKRSLSPGFAGVANPLFNAPNTVMLFGDAKESMVAVAKALEQEH